MVKHLEEIGVKKGRLQFLMMTPLFFCRFVFFDHFHMKGYPVQFHTDPRNIIDAVCYDLGN
jgi:hypothetical protein